jgi:tetratricopeptide (TPR) repeat protein
MQNVKLCLNMIVKNESKIIERLLNSVLSIIDSICICDTGSNDNTIEIIQNFMKNNNLPGEVFSEPFRNFGYNRSIALKKADAWGDYALLLDADMILKIGPEFNKKDLKDEAYQILQQNNDMKYYNTRLVKTKIGIGCTGVTHEHYTYPEGSKLLTLHTLSINDISDGGSKDNKYERDIYLLTEGLKLEPLNSRYHYYLANSYKNIGKFKEAIKYYKKRIDFGGWYEEVYLSIFEIGNCYKSLGNMKKAIQYWMEAWDFHPKRSESLYELVSYYRMIGKNNLAQHFCNLGRSIPYPKDDVLFIKSSVYDFLFDYEQTVLYFFTKLPIDYSIFLKVINYGFCVQNILRNYRFYTKKLKDFCKKEIYFNDTIEKEIEGIKDTFVASSPCITLYRTDKNPDIEYLMNIRYVNYTIKPDGTYDYRLNDGKIRTLNKFVYMNKDFKILKEHWFDQVHNTHLRYQGIEDVRIHHHKDKIHFIGCVQSEYSPALSGEEPPRIRIGLGEVDIKSNLLKPKIIDFPYMTSPVPGSFNLRSCEKNWVYFTDFEGNLRIVYEWYPFTIGITKDESLTILKKYEEVPGFFRELRGSTNGVRIGDELWFLCHMVYVEELPRHYFHIFVIFDIKTMKFKRHSMMFKFSEAVIEYCLGFAVKGNQMIISYSTMDRTSNLMVLGKDQVEKELFY